MYLTVVPAYGADYKSKKEILAAWKANTDFQIRDMSSRDDGRYINKADAVKLLPAGTVLMVRYKGNTMVTPLNPRS